MFHTTLLRYVKYLAIAAVLLPSTAAYADDPEYNFSTGCTTSTMGSYTSILTLSKPYAVYVKLGIPGQTARVNAFSVDEATSEPCRNIGQRTVNGSKWNKIGTVYPATSGRTVIEVISPQLENLPTASRPAMLLIDPSNPVCMPLIECEIPGTNGTQYIRPPSTRNDKSSLAVRTPIDPKTDHLLRVGYFAGNQKAYELASLQPFDLRYAAYGEELLQRVAFYRSGQEVVYQERTPTTFRDSFGNFIFRTFSVQPVAATVASVVVSLAVLWLIVRFIISRLYRAYSDRVHHGLVSSKSWFLKLDNVVLLYRRKYAKHFRMSISVLLLAGVSYMGYMAAQSLALSIYTVNGESMDATLKNGQSMFINKLPVTVAGITGKQPIVSRGDIIVINAIYGRVSKDKLPESEHIIVKRVIGLPGERITLRAGKLLVYNQQHPTGFDIDAGASWTRTMHKDDSTYSIDITLAQDEIFVAGDNRPGSVDSRVNGPVKLAQLIGIVAYH